MYKSTSEWTFESRLRRNWSIAQVEEWIMFDGCTMDVEIKVLITQWVPYLKQEFKILHSGKEGFSGKLMV